MHVILWAPAVQSSRCPCRPYREVDTYCLSNGEHFPAGRVDWNKTWRQQLLPLCVVASAGVKQLINTNLNGRRVITVKSKIHLVGFMGFILLTCSQLMLHTWQKWCLLNTSVAWGRSLKRWSSAVRIFSVLATVDKLNLYSTCSLRTAMRSYH